MFEVLVTTAIAAVTELYKRLQAKDWQGVATIAVAALVGALASLVPEVGMTAVEGLIAGLGVVGIHTIARQVG